MFRSSMATSTSSSNSAARKMSHSTDHLSSTFDWSSVLPCSLYACPLCAHLRQNKTETPTLGECPICFCNKVPMSAMCRCFSCDQQSCIVCHLHLLSNQTSATKNGQLCCAFCRSPYVDLNIDYLGLVHQSHEHSLPFPFMIPRSPRAAAPSTSTSNAGPSPRPVERRMNALAISTPSNNRRQSHSPGRVLPQQNRPQVRRVRMFTPIGFITTTKTTTVRRRPLPKPRKPK